MQASLVSTTGRATTWVCAACRRDILARTPLFRTATPRQTSNPPTSRQATASSIPSRRWISQSRTLSNPAPTSSSPSEQPASSTPTPKLPIFYALFPKTLSHGPPPSGPFAIDIPTLRREFLQLQASSHPDFHYSTNSPPSARRQAEATSALINTAFKTLANPLARAEYLLHELYGIDLANDEAGKESEADPEVLMTVLEAREQIEEAEKEEDLEGLRGENEERIKEAEEELGRAFAEGDMQGAKREAVRLRYWMGVREGVDNWEKGKETMLHH